MKRGAVVVMVLFLMTITTAVSFHNFLHLPPMVGMMTGLAYLKIYGFYLKKTHKGAKGTPGYDPEKQKKESVTRWPLMCSEMLPGQSGIL